MAIDVNDSHASVDEQTRPSTAVVEAISERSDVAVRDLPPLYDAIDPEALDALFDDRDSFGVVTFEYAGHDVTVRADQTVDVTPVR